MYFKLQQALIYLIVKVQEYSKYISILLNLMEQLQFFLENFNVICWSNVLSEY